jgi:sterol desaturase/sphingolipid hydroxylase (fatty acid hydroxylase superfamily)
VHQVHHSSRHLDWLAAARVHPFDQLLGRGAGFAVLRLLGFGPMLLGASLVGFALWAIFIHANVRLHFPRLEKVFATPRFHHWHHSNDLEARDKNFAGMLPIFDRIFGTLHLPEDRWPQTYGTDTALPDNYVRQLTTSLRASSTDRPSTSPPPAR